MYIYMCATLSSAHSRGTVFSHAGSPALGSSPSLHFGSAHFSAVPLTLLLPGAAPSFGGGGGYGAMSPRPSSGGMYPPPSPVSLSPNSRVKAPGYAPGRVA